MANSTYLDVVDDVGSAKISNRYKLDKGMFILIINEKFGYKDPYPDLGSAGSYWRDLDYHQEIGKWKELIPKKHDIKIGHNLMPNPIGKKESTKGNPIYYEDFIKNVKEEIVKKKPSFVVFYVASHGDANGNFLLASHRSHQKKEADKQMCSGVCARIVCRCKDKCQCEGECQCKDECHCKDKHPTVCRCENECQCKDECHCKDTVVTPQHIYKTVTETKRNFSLCHKRNLDVLVTDIQNVVDRSDQKVLSGVPKIFIAQMCRGVVEDGGEEKYLSSNDGGKETVVYTVPDADTIRFYSTLAGHPSRVYPHGCSLLLDNLYKVLREFHSEIPKDESIAHISKNEMKRLKKRINKSRFSLETKLSTDRWFVDVEDVVHGWITDVFTRVSNELGLRTGIINRCINTKQVSSRQDKQVPEYHCSLTLKLSALEMFRDGYPDV